MTVQSCSLISEPVGPQGGVVADVMSNSISTKESVSASFTLFIALSSEKYTEGTIGFR